MLKYSKTTEKILPALGSISLQLNPITKSSKNPHYNSRYADYAALMHVVRPVLVEHGCFITHSYQPEVILFGATLPTAYMVDEPVIVTRLTHIESGEWVEIFIPYAVQDATNPQKHGSAQTYARRYGLTMLLNIVTDTDDDDGNAASGGGASNREAKSRGGGGDEHGVLKINSKFDGECSMCGGQIHAGAGVAWKKGKPAVHWSCYESWKGGGASQHMPEIDATEAQPDPDDDLPFNEDDPREER